MRACTVPDSIPVLCFTSESPIQLQANLASPMSFSVWSFSFTATLPVLKMCASKTWGTFVKDPGSNPLSVKTVDDIHPALPYMDLIYQK